MKIINSNLFLLTTLCIFSFFDMNAQSSNLCANNFFYPKEGKKLTYKQYDNKDKVKSITEQSLKSIKNTATGFEAVITVTNKDDKGSSIQEGKDFIVKCENGEIKLDLSSMMMNEMAGRMKGMEVSVTGDGVGYPSNLEIGKTLPDATMEMKLGINGTTMFTGKFVIKNRKVEAKENLTTSAGTFECYKISYDLDIDMIMKHSNKVIQWMSPNIGLIKSENLDSKGIMQNHRDLTAIEQ